MLETMTFVSFGINAACPLTRNFSTQPVYFPYEIINGLIGLGVITFIFTDPKVETKEICWQCL